MIRVIFILLAALPVFAQSEAGGATINGLVSDPSSASIPEASVQITSLDTGAGRKLLTGASGAFSAVRLPAGRYKISVQKDGFKTIGRSDLVLAVGSVVSLDFRLEVGNTTEAVQVTSSLPVIETGRSQTSTVVNEKSVRDLPINGRNFLDFTILTPGVIRDTRVGDLSFAGQKGTGNSLLVDGMDSNSSFWGQSAGRAGFRNPYSFSQDAVQEFQVNTSGYAPEIGRATGGVVNVITKSGTNDFHGTAFWFFRDRIFNANTFFNNAGRIVRQPYHFNQYGGNLGGPILRNRLFFFYNYDAQRNTTPNPVFFPIAVPADAASQRGAAELAKYLVPYTLRVKNDINTGKVDWLASSKSTISGRYNAHRFLGVGAESPGLQSSLDHTGDTVMNTDSATFTHTYLLGANKVLDQRFLFYREDNPSTANSEGPEVVVRQNGVTMLAFGRANFLPRSYNQKKYNLINTLSWNVGRHSLKFGHDFKFERTINLSTTLFYGQYAFDTLADFANRRPVSFTQALTGPGTDGGLAYPNANEYAFYAQDAWRVNNRLTLNYGARYDLTLYRQGSIVNPDPGLANAGIRTGQIARDYGNIAGRFGFAYRLDNDSRYVLRGGYGMFFGRLPGLTTRLVQTANGIQIQTYSLAGAAIPTYPATLTAPPTTPGAVPDIYVMQPDFRSPQSNQWSLNFETRLDKDTALTIGYLGLRGLRLTRIRDINQFPYQVQQARYADGTPVSFFRRPGTTAPLRPNRAFGRISYIESAADSIYHGVFLQISRRYARNFQVQASYTFSKVIDTAPDPTPSVVASAAEDVKIASDTLNPNVNDRGLGDNHVPHRFVLSATWDLNYFRGLSNPVLRYLAQGWQLSTITTTQVGRALSTRSNVDLNNDGNRFSDRAPGLGRNTLEGPGLATVDLRLSKETRFFGEQVGLRLIGEAFNALNRANFNAIQQTPFNYAVATGVFTPVATFGRPTSTSDPRILQIAARLTF